jgi:DNA-binding MarR family transcriptional regulator
MTEEKFSEIAIDLDNFLPYLVDQFMATWNGRLDERLRAAGIRFEQWRVLLVTSQIGPMNIRELSAATLVPYSTLGRWLEKMEQDGLVQRRSRPRDGRAVEIFITEAGRRRFAEIYPIAAAEYQEALVGLSVVEHAALLHFIHRLRRNIGMK